MKTLRCLAVLTSLTGCSGDEPEAKPMPPASTMLTAPLRLGQQVTDQIDVEKRRALERKNTVDQGFDGS